MTSLTIRTLTASACACLVALTACSSSETPRQTSAQTAGPSVSASASNITPLTSVSQVKLPLQRYQPTQTELTTISTATDILRAQCAARFKASYVPNPEEQDENTTTALDIAGRYKPFDEKLIRAKASPTPQAANAPRPTTSTQSTTTDGTPDNWDPSPRDYAVLTGQNLDGTALDHNSIKDDKGKPLPKGGCTAESRARLSVTGGTAPHQQLGDLVAKGMDDSLDRVEHDSRLAPLKQNWAQCMKDAGHPVPNWSEPPKTPSELTKDGSDLSVDHQLAAMTCARKDNIPALQYSLDTEYQKSWIGRNKNELESLHSDFQQEMAKATKVVKR